MLGKIFSVDDVDPEVLQDFTALRKAHKAPLMATAVREMRAEAEKAGMTLEAAMRMCCARGWRGFKASWLADKGAGAAAGQQPAETAYQRSMRERMQVAAPSVARKAPGAQPQDASDYFRTIDAAVRVVPEKRAIGGAK